MAVSSQLDDLLVVQRSFYRTRFDDFALIVIDECHHAKGKDPLAEIMLSPGQRSHSSIWEVPHSVR